ncbi:MAG: diaminopimelate dehydrogenase [Firmicutes bacterium]|nr:diaminopimelate dehydrogenase [Bacillota bacterium]
MVRIGIMGYGNLARGVESAIGRNSDMTLKAVFTRRNPETVSIATEGVPVLKSEEAVNYKDEIDVMILCGGSANDLGEQTPYFAQYFNVVDSFDTHAKILQHYDETQRAAEDNGNLAAISCGWDPGLFSINRIYAESALPGGTTYTFWGKGLSQGHSDAIRRIEGVADARQYTIPVEEALDRIRAGETPELTTREKHTRECYVVAEEGADTEAIRNAIVNMPNYFDEYDTTVHFISQEELDRNHRSTAHGGFVLHSGATAPEYSNVIEYSLKLDSNPYFTGSVLVAAARAVYRMRNEGRTGCITMADIAPSYLIETDSRSLLETMI